MDDVVSTVFEAAENIVELLDDPETAKRWEEPSALQGLSVGGLVAHLLMGAAYMHRLLDGPDGVTGPVVSVGEYTAAMKMDDFDADLHRYIRDKNERSATHVRSPRSPDSRNCSPLFTNGCGPNQAGASSICVRPFPG